MKIKKIVEVIDNHDLDIFAMEEIDGKTMRKILLIDKLNEIIDWINQQEEKE